MLPPSKRRRPPTSCQGSMHWAPISKRSCGKSNPDLQPFNPCIIPVFPEFIPQKGNLSEPTFVYSQAHGGSPLWKGSDGRVARLSSAKAATAVRIRFGPHRLNGKPRCHCDSGASSFSSVNTCARDGMGPTPAGAFDFGSHMLL